MKAEITSQGGHSASHGGGSQRGHRATSCSSSRRSPREDYSVTRNGKKRLSTNTIQSDSISLQRPLFSVHGRHAHYCTVPFAFVLPFFFLPSRSGPFGNCSKVNTGFIFFLIFLFCVQILATQFNLTEETFFLHSSM